MSRTFIRARKPEEKSARRAELVEAARRLLDGGLPLQELSLTELARVAGVVKGNVYRYFESREAVLIALLFDEAERWVAQSAPLLQPGRKTTSTLDGLVTLLARSLASAPRLCQLTASVPWVLEQSLSAEAIVTFKRQMLLLFDELAGTLERCCPALPADSYRGLLYDTTTLVAGLYPSTHPNAHLSLALVDPGLRFYQRDFTRELTRHLRALAVDYAARATTRPRERAGSSRTGSPRSGS